MRHDGEGMPFTELAARDAIEIIWTAKACCQRSRAGGVVGLHPLPHQGKDMKS